MDRSLTNVELLEKFLELKNFKHERLNAEAKSIVARYSIKKEGNETDILSDILSEKVFKEVYKGKVCNYYGAQGETAKEAIDIIQYFKKRFTENRQKGFETFENFVEWWCEQENKCYYCGIDQEITTAAMDNKELLESKKFYSTLQIERKIPGGNYDSDNCVLACVLCNNAKSDLIKDSEEFKKFFGEPIKKYWEHIKCKLKDQTLK